MTHHGFVLVAVTMSLLAGCNDSGNGVSGSMSGTPVDAGASSATAGGSAGQAGAGAVGGSLARLVERAADAEPGTTDEVVDLLAGIAALFGAPDGEPIALGEPETLAALIRRLGG